MGVMGTNCDNCKNFLMIVNCFRFFSYRKWENAMYFCWKCFCYHEETGQWLWMWNSMLRIWWSDVGKNHWLHLKIDGVINCFANSCQHRLEFLVHFETGRWTVGAAWAPIPDLCPWLLNCSRALNFTTIFLKIEIRQNITHFTVGSILLS